MIVGAAFGMFIDNFVFRRGRYVGILSKQIITMGFVSVFFGAIPLIFGNPESIPFEPLYNYTKYGDTPNIVIEIGGGELVITKHALISAAITAVGFLANFKGLEGIGRWQMVIVYSLILLIILIKPEGLFGKKVIKKV